MRYAPAQAINRALSRRAIEAVRGRAAEDVRPYHVTKH